MLNNDLFNLLGYIKVSSIRKETLKSLEREMKMPTEIKKETGLSMSQVSSALTGLKRKDLVICVNEDMRKGRLYKCTELGHEILEHLK